MKRLQVKWWRFWRGNVQGVDALGAALMLYREGYILEAQVTPRTDLYRGLLWLQQSKLCHAGEIKYRGYGWLMLEDHEKLLACMHREAARMGVRLVARHTLRGRELSIEDTPFQRAVA